METLIQKAIAAIKEDQKDYAVGLLEGALALIPASTPNPLKMYANMNVASGTVNMPPNEGQAIEQQTLTKINNIQGFSYEQEN